MPAGISADDGISGLRPFVRDAVLDRLAAHVEDLRYRSPHGQGDRIGLGVRGEVEAIGPELYPLDPQRPGLPPFRCGADSEV